MTYMLLSSPPTSATSLSFCVLGMSFLGFMKAGGHRNASRKNARSEPYSFETLHSLIGDPVFLVRISDEGLPGYIVEANEAASELYGYTLSEFRNRTLWDLLKPDPDLARLLKERFPLFLQTGRFRGESVHISKSGRAFPVEFSARLIVKDGQRFNLTLIRDLTARKRAEETEQALAQAERKILLGEKVRPVIDDFCLELGRIFPWMDVGFYKKTPYGTAELLAGGRSYPMKSLPVNDSPEGQGAVSTSIKTGRTQIFDIQDPAYPEELRDLLRHTGMRYICSIPLILRGEVNGALSFVTAEDRPLVFEDILSLEKLSSRLALLYVLGEEQGEIRLAYDALQAVSEAISIVEKTGEILWVNDAFLNLTGYTRAEIVGRSAGRIASDPRIGTLYQGLWAEISSEKTFESETLNRRKDGSLYVAHEQVTPLFDEDGHPVRYIKIQRDVTRTREDEIRMWRLANYDDLTGLPNRNLLKRTIQGAIESASKGKEILGLVYLDCDRFKDVNDTLGHDAGDRLLKLVADRLCLSIRMTDTIGRLGGDEFVVVRPVVRDAEEIARFGRDVLSAFSDPFLLDGKAIQLGCSAGIVLYPVDGNDAETLLRKADIALYQAKSMGRGRLQMFETHQESAVHWKVNLSRELRSALEKREFALHYQPIVDLKSGRITGVETLLRWKKDDGSIVYPNHFIPLAEEIGLIHPLGDWILAEAFRQATEWKTMGITPGKITVNLSPLQLSDPGFFEKAESLLAEWGFPDDEVGITFEITESRALEIQDAAKRLASLRAKGVRIALDDFGTGFSSLSFLKEFPVDTLKIDQSFMNEIDTGLNDRTIIKTIVKMAKDLGLRVIAEGVETEKQLIFLKEVGCDAVQGFYYHRALPPEDIVRLLSDQNTVPGWQDSVPKRGADGRFVHAKRASEDPDTRDGHDSKRKKTPAKGPKT